MTVNDKEYRPILLKDEGKRKEAREEGKKEGTRENIRWLSSDVTAFGVWGKGTGFTTHNEKRNI